MAAAAFETFVRVGTPREKNSHLGCRDLLVTDSMLTADKFTADKSISLGKNQRDRESEGAATDRDVAGILCGGSFLKIDGLQDRRRLKRPRRRTPHFRRALVRQGFALEPEFRPLRWFPRECL